MVGGIANILVSRISTLNFVDKIAGVVKPMVKVDVIEDEDGYRVVRKVFPVACGVTAAQCEEQGLYTDLVPDDKYRSIIYFEDRGAQFVDRQGSVLQFAGNLRLVCWMNLKHFVVASGKECTLDGLVLAKLLSEFPNTYFNSGNYQRILINITRVLPKSQDIFGFYTYREETNQYLLHPYDYFAVDLTVNFGIHKDCLDQIEIQAPSC